MDFGPLTTSPAVPLRFLVGLVAAGAALPAMDFLMARLPEGMTPPFVAAGVLTESHPNEAPPRLALAVHYLAGGLTGPLFVWLLFASEALIGPQSLRSTAAAALVLYLLMVAFFVGVVLPRSRIEAERRGTVARDWALSAAAYLVVLVPIVAVASRFL